VVKSFKKKELLFRSQIGHQQTNLQMHSQKLLTGDHHPMVATWINRWLPRISWCFQPHSKPQCSGSHRYFTNEDMVSLQFSAWESPMKSPFYWLFPFQQVGFISSKHVSFFFISYTLRLLLNNFIHTYRASFIVNSPRIQKRAAVARGFGRAPRPRLWRSSAPRLRSPSPGNAAIWPSKTGETMVKP